MDLYSLLHNKHLSFHIEKRLNEFKRLGKYSKTLFDFNPYINIRYEADLLSELCFCILTANFSAEKGIIIQANTGTVGFRKFKADKLLGILKHYGHRFPQQRMERIKEVRKKFNKVVELIKEIDNPYELRKLLANQESEFKIKGFGYKEASHFLRNIGYDNVAILDRHVIKFLKKNGYIEEFKTLTPKIYEEIEKKVLELAKRLEIKPSALDLYIFYIATGKVLK